MLAGHHSTKMVDVEPAEPAVHPSGVDLNN